MGATIWVDVEGRTEDDLLSDNSIMLRLEEQLARLSGKLGVPNLADFYDYSEMEEQFADRPDDDAHDDAVDDDEEPTPRGAWFEPAQALAAVRAIHDHLEQHPADLDFKPDASRQHWPSDLMEELKDCRGVLEDAAANGKKFRFLIVP